MIGRLVVWAAIGVALSWALEYVLVHAGAVLVVVAAAVLIGRLRRRAGA